MSQTNDNKNADLMRHFPNPDALPESYDQKEARTTIWLILEAARAAIDEVSERADKLSVDEHFEYGHIAVKLGEYAIQLYKGIDK